LDSCLIPRFFFGGDSEGEDDASRPARDLPPGTEEQLFPPSSLGAPSPQDLPPGTEEQFEGALYGTAAFDTALSPVSETSHTITPSRESDVSASDGLPYSAGGTATCGYEPFGAQGDCRRASRRRSSQPSMQRSPSFLRSAPRF
jgi:hypothetical protein